MKGYHARLKALKARGVYQRVLADCLGVDESVVSRLLRDPARAERFFSKGGRAARLAALEADPVGFMRRWVLAREEELIRRSFPLLSDEAARSLALERVRKRRPDLF